MAARLVQGIDNHEKLSKYTFNKYDKRSPLSQLQAMYNIQPTRPVISVQLPERHEIVQRREGVTTSLSSYEHGNAPRLSHRSQRSLRHKSAPVWVKVPNHEEMWESCALSEVPKTRRVVFSAANSIRPYTTTAKHSQAKQATGTQTRGDKERRSTGQSKSSKSAALYRFSHIRSGSSSGHKSAAGQTSAAQHHKQAVQLYTSLIKEQWDSKERQYIKSGTYVRGKPEDKEKDLLQWFTFEGASPGALQAFTQDSERPEEDNPAAAAAEFSIEANVGKEVAAKLVLGGYVRIGKNGKLLLSERSPEDDDLDTAFYNKCEDVIEMTRNSAVKHEPLYPPLCWRDVEKDAHVLISSDIRIPQTQQVNKSVPVIYNKEPVIRPYIPTDVQTNHRILNDLLSHNPTHRSLSPDYIKHPATYDEILESRAPDTSRMERSGDSKHFNTPMSKYLSKEMMSCPDDELKPPNTAPTKTTTKSKHVNRNGAGSARIRTPAIPDDVRNGIHRQVTMPSYKVIPGGSDKVAGRPNAMLDPSERVPTPVRPPKYIPSYNAGYSTSTSIPYHNSDKEKYFVKFNTPISRIVYTNGVRSPQDETPRSQTSNPNTRETDKGTNLVEASRANTVKTAPPDLQHVALVGKSHPFEKIVRNSHAAPKQGENLTSSIDISSSEVTVSEQEVRQLPTADNTMTGKPSRLLDISLPAVDMISASSAAVNSITDFSEYNNETSLNTNSNSNYNGMYINDVDIELRERSAANRSDSRTQSLPMSCHSAKRPPSIASFEEDPSKYDISVEIVEMKKVLEV